MKTKESNFLETNCCNCAAPINHNIGKCDYCGTFFRTKQNTYQGPTYDSIPKSISHSNVSFYVGTSSFYMGTTGLIK